MSTRHKRVAGVLGIASLVLVWRVYVIITDYLPAAAEGSPAEMETAVVVDPSQTSMMPDEEDAARWATQRELAERPWGRDPFEPLNPVSGGFVEGGSGALQPGPPRFQFTGVAKTDGQWGAIVAGQVVRVGDVLEGEYKVVAIGKNSITVAAKGWTFELVLGSDAVKTRPGTEDPR